MPHRRRAWFAFDLFASLTRLRELLRGFFTREVRSGRGDDLKKARRAMPELYPLDYRNSPSEAIGSTALPLALTAARVAQIVAFDGLAEAVAQNQPGPQLDRPDPRPTDRDRDRDRAGGGSGRESAGAGNFRRGGDEGWGQGRRGFDWSLGVDGDEVEDERQRFVFADHTGDEAVIALDGIVDIGDVLPRLIEIRRAYRRHAHARRGR
jgi:hypothetical protein